MKLAPKELTNMPTSGSLSAALLCRPMYFMYAVPIYHSEVARKIVKLLDIIDQCSEFRMFKFYGKRKTECPENPGN